MEQKTLAELTGQNIEIAFADAVAIAQQLICEPDVLRGAQPPFGPLTPESVAVTDSGAVLCLHTAATPTVIEVGLLMQSMLGTSQSLPGGLRYTISRAIHEVEAPPFESSEDFSRALERFEAGDRREQVASLYERARAASAVNSGDGFSPEMSAYPERRVRQQSATALRRQLRDADQRFYEAHCHSSHAAHKAGKGRSRRVPIAACMIAGVALVAAGEIVHVQQPPGAIGATQPPLSEAGMVTGPQTTPADAMPQSFVTTPPVRATERSPRSAVGRSPARKTNLGASALTTHGSTKVAGAGSSRARNAATRSPRKPAENWLKQDHSKSKPEHDKSDHGLLRIRFVWDNPFH